MTTGDHDDRVVPAHPFKFAAQLHAKLAGDAPVLIRVEKDAGLGAGTATSKIVDVYADALAFTFANTADPAEAPHMLKDEPYKSISSYPQSHTRCRPRR